MEELDTSVPEERDRQGPDKTSAGDDKPRNPRDYPPELRSERRGTRRIPDPHMIITRAQVHAAAADVEDTETRVHLPPSSGVHGMDTRARSHTSAGVMEPDLSPVRPSRSKPGGTAQYFSADFFSPANRSQLLSVRYA